MIRILSITGLTLFLAYWPTTSLGAISCSHVLSLSFSKSQIEEQAIHNLIDHLNKVPPKQRKNIHIPYLELLIPQIIALAKVVENDYHKAGFKLSLEKQRRSLDLMMRNKHVSYSGFLKIVFYVFTKWDGLDAIQSLLAMPRTGSEPHIEKKWLHRKLETRRFFGSWQKQRFKTAMDLLDQGYILFPSFSLMEMDNLVKFWPKVRPNILSLENKVTYDAVKDGPALEALDHDNANHNPLRQRTLNPVLLDRLSTILSKTFQSLQHHPIDLELIILTHYFLIHEQPNFLQTIFDLMVQERKPYSLTQFKKAVLAATESIYGNGNLAVEIFSEITSLATMQSTQPSFLRSFSQQSAGQLLNTYLNALFIQIHNN